jgi:phosphatidylinositol kinase/protein kinase (PI-3  family)
LTQNICSYKIKCVTLKQEGDILIKFLIPEYVDNIGDCCRLSDTSCETIFHKKVDSVLKEIFKERCLDLKALRHKSSRVLNQKNLIPLYIKEDEILMPIKIRTPKVLRDGGYGYVNAASIEKILDKHIVLNDGSCICYIESIRTISSRFKMVKTLENALEDKSSNLRLLEKDLKQPLTREDFSIIYREIAYIRKRLEEIR